MVRYMFTPIWVEKVDHELWHIEAETKWPAFPDDIFRYIFLNGNIYNSIRISLKFVPNVPINNIPAFVWRRPGDKPLSKPMMFTLLRHLYVTRPQWVKIKDSHHKGGVSEHMCP